MANSTDSGGELKPCSLCFSPHVNLARDLDGQPKQTFCKVCGCSAPVAAWSRRSTDRREGEDSSAADRWHPIATAPKDGAAILGHQATEGDHKGRTAVVWTWDGHLWHCADYPGLHPTHWMPLPTPPGTRGVEDGKDLAHSQAPQSPSTRREEVIEECARVADDLGIGYASWSEHEKDCYARIAKALDRAAARIRALKSPSPSRKQG